MEHLFSSDWIYEIGNGSWGWGNNELEYYRSENTSVANGYLTITAKQQYFNGYDYTSSRIKHKEINFSNMAGLISELNYLMVKVYGLLYGC